MSGSDPGAGTSVPKQSRLFASQESRREVLAFVKTVAGFLLLFLLLKSYVVEGYEVQGTSMEPTLMNEERILVFKLTHVLSQSTWFSGIEALQTGDIVVFNSADTQERYVKRLIAKGPKPDASNTVNAVKVGETAGSQVTV
ncbi:MAG: signal peptidase I, partial [Candidatus Hydrogenedentales bacterium]